VKTPAASVTAETIGQVLALELEAHLDLALGLAPRVRDGGVILFFSDTGLRVGWPSYPVYLAAKGGLEAATRSLARALGPRLTVCCVAPGSVEGAPGMDAVMVKERTALGRPAAPAEMAAAVLGILSLPAAVVQGQVIVVDGGRQLYG
jgi:Dehydrogenases with different specificities (related to short-chain alcohol dehydrogenases)